MFSILIVIFITVAAGQGCTHTKTKDSRLVFPTKMWSDKWSDVLVMSLLWKETESFLHHHTRVRKPIHSYETKHGRLESGTLHYKTTHGIAD